jgi:hypothetical protein
MIDRDMLREFDDALERACDYLAEKIKGAMTHFETFGGPSAGELDKLNKAVAQ